MISLLKISLYFSLSVTVNLGTNFVGPYTCVLKCKTYERDEPMTLSLRLEFTINGVL